MQQRRSVSVTLSWLAITLLLAGCVNRTSFTPPANQIMPAATRTAQLSAIKQWDITGQVAVQTEAGADTANVDWQQKSVSHYVLRIYGNFGSGSAIITGNPTMVSLVASDGKTRVANTPEKVLFDYTGWFVPISNLHYWIRGLAVPEISSQPSYDEFSHITELKQAGWTVRYDAFTNANGVDMPRKISLSNKSIHIKILIQSWQFDNDTTVATHQQS